MGIRSLDRNSTTSWRGLSASLPTLPNSWRAAHPWCWPVTTMSCRHRRTFTVGDVESSSDLPHEPAVFCWAELFSGNSHATQFARPEYASQGGALMSAHLRKAIVDLSRNSADTASRGHRPIHSFSGAEQRHTPGSVYCVVIEMFREPCLKIGLPV